MPPKKVLCITFGWASFFWGGGGGGKRIYRHDLTFLSPTILQSSDLRLEKERKKIISVRQFKNKLALINST